MTSYTIHTNLDPAQLTTVAVEVYKHWLEFALGRASVGLDTVKNGAGGSVGRILKHPSGKYASSISWKRTGQYQVTIMADTDIAKEGEWIEHGAKGFNLKEIMLAQKSKVGKDGYRYRTVMLPPDLDNDPGAGAMMNAGPIESFVTGSKNGQHVKKSFAKMWAKPIKRTRFKTMTDKPGSSPWIIPARPAYAPAKIFSELLQQEYGS